MSLEKRNSLLTKTIKSYGSKLFNFIKSKINSVEDTEDILQEVWYQFSRLTNLDEIENISGWLYSVSRNKVTDFYRKKKTKSLEDYTIEDSEGNFSINEILLIDTSNDPELSFFQEVFWSELMKAIDELPEKQKLVYVMNELEDKTLKEIAELTDENIKTIISRKGYAAKHIRKKLQPLYDELLN
ncbi:MAG TPA: sigma-70 family RNA polymerase sigma factor [Saprospiraceae bacterium]|nr:sigma-70 family RNA polymerase sigma factor [Saprospiraceae bacterium]HHH52822.1 sigma-70 family RNA polymerase sigma factor [Bacteroidota bacterium]